MTATEYVLDVLGGASVFKSSTLPTSMELRQRIKRGLPYRSLESVRERLRLSVPEAASVLHMPPRTLARRRQTRRLDGHESDRLYRIARVAAQAFAVFSTEELPIHLLDTDVGARQIEDILGRIEHGAVS